MNKIYQDGKVGLIYFMYKEYGKDDEGMSKVFDIWFNRKELNRWLMVKRGVYRSSTCISYMER